MITGAGAGMGRAAALRFAAEGAHVIAADIRLEKAEETVGTHRAGGRQGPKQSSSTFRIRSRSSAFTRRSPRVTAASTSS